MKTEEPAHECLLERDAALAEAYHVDGLYKLAGDRWAELAEEGYCLAESALKAAISRFSLDDSSGSTWLEKAKLYGAGDDADLVRAQFCWRQGALDQAVGILEDLQSHSTACAEVANSLGVLYALRRDPVRARTQFRLALSRDDGDAEALANLASMDLREGQEPSWEMLARAALLLPHRYEAHVLASRWHRKIGNVEAAEALLAKARLRRTNLGPVFSTAARTEQAVESKLRIVFDRQQFQVHAWLLWPEAAQDAPPRIVALNPGYSQVSINGLPTAKRVHGTVPESLIAGLTPGVAVFEIPRDSWRKCDGGTCLEIFAEGRPQRPCVRFHAGEFEMGEPSAWAPVLLPRVETRWNIACEMPESWSVFTSPVPDRRGGVDIIGAASTDRVQFVFQGSNPTIECVGKAPPRAARRACFEVVRTAELWTRIAGERREGLPPLVVVSAPQSTFCYARRNYIRIASGALDAWNLLCHETGHLWWGVDVAVPREDQWLSEGLAEYSLHLAEDIGFVSGYRRAVIENLAASRVYARKSLHALSSKSDVESARVLREKGAYVFGMLRFFLGEDKFRCLLRTAYRVGRAGSLDGYTFQALASRIHGHTLNWFFNQWVHAEAELAFRVEHVDFVVHPHSVPLSFDVFSSGAVTPGIPVPVAIMDENGNESVLESNLELGRCRVATTLSSRPQRICVDPQYRFYALRQDYGAFHHDSSDERTNR